MRLLDARKLELVDVRDDDIPRYAILSHTWGDDEVTLQDMRRMESKMPQAFNRQKQTIAEKKGYAKIKNAAAMALKRGLTYLWVDTCCIDKTSSSELSEAINSMYLWYKQAAECYAILSDVEPVASVAPDRWSNPDRYSQLRSSRWFTRGWTLQELIAPTDMHFFARDWSPLGQKQKPRPFTEILSDITGIEIEVLDGRVDPAQLSVATRMKWAAHRETTRLEDTAYCLMGLFQVNMPLLYGEGARAFARLQEEIIQTTDDQSLFAWSSIAPPEKTEDSGDPDALCGLLAACPTDFQHAGGMQPLPPLPVYASAPSTMTNLGLRVQLYLRPIHELEGVPMEEDFYAILDSVVRVEDTYLCPAITLRRLSVDQFARLRNRPHKLLAPVQSQLASEAEGYRTVYVRQNPVYYNLPQIRVAPLHSTASGPPVTSLTFGPNNVPITYQRQQPPPIMPQFTLVDAFPSARWNPNTLTMGVKYSRELQVMALFRFQDTTDPVSPRIFDVVLGLRRLDAMQWEGWCFQLSRPKSLFGLPPPASVVKTTNERIKGLIAKSKKGIVSSTALRESLGDDPHLISDATVTGVQLQGRLYVSVLVSLRPETHEEFAHESRVSELQLAVQEELRRPPRIHTQDSRLLDLQDAARTVTGPCARVFSTLFEEPDESAARTTARLPVRGTPRISPRDTIMNYLDKQKNGPALAGVRLALAAHAGDMGSMSWLQPSRNLVNSATSDEYQLPMLHWAMAGGHDSTFKYLVERGADIYKTAKHGLSILHIMALFRHGVGKTVSLPGEREDLNQELAAAYRTEGFYREAPLHLAAAYQDPAVGHKSKLRSIQILRKLAEAGYVAVRNALDETPVHRAAALNNPQVIKALVPLLPQSVDFVDCHGRSPLWHAAATGSKDAIDALIALGASVNIADDLGMGPLHAACREGHVPCVLKLLIEGADPRSATFKLDLTPLDLAAMFGHPQVIDVFYGHDQGANLTQNMLDRSLHIASSCGNLECVKFLIAIKADPCVSFDYHFIRDSREDYATVDGLPGNAREAAAYQGHWDVVPLVEVHEKGPDAAPRPPMSPLSSLDSPPSPTWSTGGVWGGPASPGRQNINTYPARPPGRQQFDTPPPGQIQYSQQPRPPPGQAPYPEQPPPPPITSGYSTTLPAHTSVYPDTRQFRESDASPPPGPDQPLHGLNRLWVVDNPPGAYWHPNHGPAGCYFFELQGEAVDKVARSLDSMYRSGVRPNYPPPVYVGNTGFEKYKRLPLGGFVQHNRPAEMAEALRQQNRRIRREEKRQQEEAATGARKPDEDLIAEASHLHELADTHVDALANPDGVSSGDEKPPPPLVYAGTEGHWRYYRWAAGGFGYSLGQNQVTSASAGEAKREEEAALDRIRDAHLFRTATLARTGPRPG